MHRIMACSGIVVLFLGAAACDSAPSDNSGTGGYGSTSTDTSNTVASCGSGDTSEPIVNGGCKPEVLPGAGSLSQPYGIKLYCLGKRQYVLQLNEWNSTAAQNLTIGGGDFYFKVTKQDAVLPTNGGPSGYPSMFIGANAGRVTNGSGMPKAVDSISSVPTTWNWTDNGARDNAADSAGHTNIYNAAYDVWFSKNAAGDPDKSAPSGAFLMVWLHKPSQAQPLGNVQYPSVTVNGVDGKWDAWVGTNAGVPCISYVRNDTDPVYSMSFDMNAFIKDAVQNRPNTVTNAMYLTNIFAGFEIWSGGVGLQTTSFCAGVN